MPWFSSFGFDSFDRWNYLQLLSQVLSGFCLRVIVWMGGGDGSIRLCL